MSRGIWTKHLSVDGKAYFYNSAQNRSVWIPPPESIIHEAINMRPPTYIELAGASSSYGKSSENDVMSNSHGLPAPEQIYGEQQQFYDIANDNYRINENHNGYQQYNQEENNFHVSQDQFLQPQENYYPQQLAATLQDYSFNDYQDQNVNHESSGNQYQYQDQRDSNNNYHQQETQQGLQPHHQPEQVQLVSADELMSFGVSSKQKQQNSKRFRAQANDESDQGGRSTSSYLMQKSEFEARAGSRDDESGKWLVR